MTKQRIQAGDGDPRHGTPNGYDNHYCRCASCKEAQAAYRREKRAVNRALRGPQGPRKSPVRQTPVKDYFYANLYIAAEDECKIWPFTTNNQGYGVVELPASGGTRLYGTHRIACLAFNGPPPPGTVAAHGPCHETRCWNGYHLSWKTERENVLDRWRDGTMRYGLASPAAKITPVIARAIRDEYALTRATVAGLALKNGLAPATVQALVEGRTWKEVLRVGEPLRVRPKTLRGAVAS